jgi:hypothetical protein
LLRECFGPSTLLITYTDPVQLPCALALVPGSLTATLHAEDTEEVAALVELLSRKAGRVLFAGWPTGVAVTWAQHHGGPYPATTSSPSCGLTEPPCRAEFPSELRYQEPGSLRSLRRLKQRHPKSGLR